HEAGWEHSSAIQYNLQDIPTWHLIDAEGVIRARDPFGDKLIPAVKAALKPLKMIANP
ncbi:MAG: hypothetical protein GY851_21810, partial [bacterium]|nr:hypothetical protein [bacterium]